MEISCPSFEVAVTPASRSAMARSRSISVSPITASSSRNDWMTFSIACFSFSAARSALERLLPPFPFLSSSGVMTGGVHFTLGAGFGELRSLRIAITRSSSAPS
ncbi:hypothetical protein D9M68_952620 [compost metagenome]